VESEYAFLIDGVEVIAVSDGFAIKDNGCCH
jgi:hypothetical protein